VPFDRPSLKTIITRTENDIQSRFLGYNKLRRTVTAVLARVLSGLAHGLYGYQEWISKQILPDTADETFLLRWGAIYGVVRKPGAPAQGNIAASGIDGSQIPTGTVWQRSDGMELASTASVTIASGQAMVPVTAPEIGVAGNTDPGALVSITSPIEGVEPQAAVDAAGISGGADIEPIDQFRNRVLDRTRNIITGANPEVYIQWALEVSGVTRAWCYPNHQGLGTVGVAFVCDGQPGGIIPDSGKVDEVAQYIEQHIDPATGRVIGRPVCAEVYVFAPIEVPVDFTLRIVPNNSGTRAAVTAALDDLLRREAQPGGTILLSHIHEAISLAAGEVDHVLTSPAANVVNTAGQISTLGVITWV
jgi:uncharacterized phage protein gp47/JayE